MLLVLGISHAAHADEHLVSDLDPMRVYDVLADGEIIHGNLQPGARGYVTFDAPAGAEIQVVASGEGDVTPPATISDLTAEPTGPGALTLAWTAPGDDGTIGQADAYEIRWSTSASGLETSPVVIVDAPEPQPAGSAETYTATGLPTGTTVYVAIVTRDDVGNRSDASNVVTASIPSDGGAEDVTPPAAIDDLTAAPDVPGALALAWTAPGDDGTTGQASGYSVRWATSEAGLASSPEVLSGPASPSPSGSTETFLVSGLPEGQTVYLAVLAHDEAGNWSNPSNTASATVAGGSGSGGEGSDTTPPAAIDDLALEHVSAHSATLSWTATGDDGTTGRASAYDLRYALEPIDELNFSNAVPVAIPSPASAGTAEEHEITGLDSRTTYYFAVRVEDEAGNVSPLSESVPAQTRGRDDSPNPPGNPHGWVHNGWVALEWEPSPDPVVVGYHVYRLPDGGEVETRLTDQPLAEVSFEDRSVEEGRAYTYRITAVDDVASESIDEASTWLRATRTVPPAAVIEKMYPNPAHAGDAVVFRIGIPEVGPGHPDGQRVTIDLYDVAGHRVGRVFDDFVQPGVREVSWSPQASGRAFVPGMYVTLVTAGRASVRDRLVIAR